MSYIIKLSINLHRTSALSIKRKIVARAKKYMCMINYEDHDKSSNLQNVLNLTLHFLDNKSYILAFLADPYIRMQKNITINLIAHNNRTLSILYISKNYAKKTKMRETPDSIKTTKTIMQRIDDFNL